MTANDRIQQHREVKSEKKDRDFFTDSPTGLAGDGDGDGDEVEASGLLHPAGVYRGDFLAWYFQMA